MVIVEKLLEWRLAGETEVLGWNLPQRHFVHHKYHMTRPGFEHGPPRWEASDYIIIIIIIILLLLCKLSFFYCKIFVVCFYILVHTL
jgi:hypothetical protein